MTDYNKGDPILINNEEGTVINTEPLTVLTDTEEKVVDPNEVTKDWSKM